MELTKEQLQQVETYLDKKSFDFIDLKVEVLDHIISDIESFLGNNYSFEYAFKITVLKWNPQLKESSSWIFGMGYAAPKLIIRKAKKVYWKQYLFLLSSYFLPFLLLTHYNFKIQNPTEFNFFIILKGTIILSFVAFIYMFLSKNNKTKTTYGFILKSQSLGAFTGLIVVAVFFTKLKELNGINIGMFCSFIFMTYSYFHFYKKHKEAIRKYENS